jgi:uncharacterized membrane protein
MILGVDYKFRDDMKQDTVPIEILTGMYKGVVCRFTKVSIHEQKNNTATLKFDYELFETGENTMVSLRKDVLFTEYLGLILNSMILSTLDREEDNEKTVETVG